MIKGFDITCTIEERLKPSSGVHPKTQKKWRKQPYRVRLEGDDDAPSFVVVVPDERVPYEALEVGTTHKLRVYIESSVWGEQCFTDVVVLGYGFDDPVVVLGYGD